MCVTEIWTYRECECRYKHFVACRPCFEEKNKNNNSNNSDSGKSDGDFDGVSRADGSDEEGSGRSSFLPDTNICTTASHLPASSLQQRTCSVHRLVDREFLEPICDECVVEEAYGSMELNSEEFDDDADKGRRLESRYTNGNGTVNGIDRRVYNGIDEYGTLILESNVEIEIVAPGQLSEDTTMDGIISKTDSTQEESRGRPHIRRSAISSQTTPPPPPSSSSRPPSRVTSISAISFDLDRDADDELSLHGPAPVQHNTADSNAEDNITVTKRGRLRTRSKELRRRGMDISREELRLRIASAWSSGEKRHMEAWRLKLRGGKAGGGDEKERAAAKERERAKEKDKGAWGLGAFVGRVGRSLGRGRRETRSQENSKHRSREPEAKALAAPDKVTTRPELSSSTINTIFEYDNSTPQSPSPSPIPPSPQKRSSAETPAAVFTARSSWEQHLREDLGAKYQRLVPKRDNNGMEHLEFKDEEEFRQHLLSTCESLPSIPATMSGEWEGERLDFSSGEFERGASGRLFGGWERYGNEAESEAETEDEDEGEGDITSIDDHTSVATRSMHGHAQSIDSRISVLTGPSATSSVGNDRTYPNQPALSIHPLTTPLYSPRSSSFFPPPANRPSESGQRIPKSAFVCVGEAERCARGCGAVVREQVESCVCDFGTARSKERVCRAREGQVVIQEMCGGREICDGCAGQGIE